MVASIATAGNDPWLIAPDKIDDYVKADFKFWEPDLRKIEPQCTAPSSVPSSWRRLRDAAFAGMLRTIELPQARLRIAARWAVGNGIAPLNWAAVNPHIRCRASQAAARFAEAAASPMSVLIVMLIPAALLALLVRDPSMFQPFNLPSNSMAPTLVAGDQFIVSKTAYGYSRYSFPLRSRPVLGARLRGEAGLWRCRRLPPAEGPVDGLCQARGRTARRPHSDEGRPAAAINGQARCARRATCPTCPVWMSAEPVQPSPSKRWRERLPNGVTHETLDCVDNGFYDNTPEYVVPAGHYFMMGDNRDNSTDSRVLSAMSATCLTRTWSAGLR